MKRHHGEQGLDGSGSAEEVPRRALRGRDGNVLEVIAEDALESVVLGDVADGSARGVSVDMNNVRESCSTLLKGCRHGACRC